LKRIFNKKLMCGTIYTKNIVNDFVRLTVLGEKHSAKRIKLSPPKEPDKESGQPVAQSRPSPTSSLQCKTAWSNQDRETKIKVV
jgi:hypothetical protein